MKDGVHAYHFSGVYPERILQRRECQLHSEEAHRNPPHKFYTGHRGLEGRHQKIMLRILSEKLEEIPMMNQRVLMTIVDEFRTHQIDVHKRLWWSERSRFTQILQDNTEGVARYDPGAIKLANRLGQPRVGGTSRFYFT